jgi:hypothetical protein
MVALQVQMSHQQLRILHWRGRPRFLTLGLPQQAPKPSSRGAGREALVLPRILIWPVLTLVMTGVTQFTIEAIWPDLRNFFVPPTLAPLLLAYGAWVGYRAVMMGAGLVPALASGVILGLLPLGLDIIGFGIVLDRGVDQGVLSGVFGMAYIVFGTLFGIGFTRSGMLDNA